MPHEVTVEPYSGAGAYGPRYGTTTVVRCLFVGQTRLVRNMSGEESVSSAQFYCDPDENVPPQSRVTCPDGTKRTAMTVGRFDPGKLPLPGSMVVFLE